MPRKVQPQASPWFRRFMILTGLLILISAILAFSALRKNDYAAAFPLFIGIMILLVFEVVLMVLHNRSRI